MNSDDFPCRRSWPIRVVTVINTINGFVVNVDEPAGAWAGRIEAEDLLTAVLDAGSRRSAHPFIQTDHDCSVAKRVAGRWTAQIGAPTGRLVVLRDLVAV